MNLELKKNYTELKKQQYDVNMCKKQIDDEVRRYDFCETCKFYFHGNEILQCYRDFCNNLPRCPGGLD